MDLVVSANDAKLVRVDGADLFPVDPGPDSLTVVDASSPTPRVVAELSVVTSIVGPPQAVALSPAHAGDGADAVRAPDADAWRAGRLAVVGAPVEYDRDRNALVFGTYLQVVDLSMPTPTLERVEIGAHPQGLAFTPDGSTLLAATVAGEVVVCRREGQRLEVVERVAVSTGRLAGIAVVPDGSAAIVALRDEHAAAVLDLADGLASLTPFRVATGVSPYVVDVDAAGAWAVIGNVGAAGQPTGNGLSIADSDVITLVDTSTRPFRTVDHAAVPSLPEGVAISPDGRWVAALCMAGSQLPPDRPGHSPRGSLVVFRNRAGKLREEGRQPAGAASQGVVFTADSRRLLAQWYADRQLAVYELGPDGLRDAGTRVDVTGGPASLRAAPR